MRAFTIVGRNYLAHARVLGQSLQRTNPGLQFDAFLLDDDGSLDIDAEPFGLIVPEDVFDAEEFEKLISIYSVMELATAVKPRVLLHLLDESEGPVAYLDPDLWFFGSLDPVAALAAEHGIVLTPHSIAPMRRDGRRPAETEILKSGVYNLGFVAVGQSARPFLDWWWERLERDCVVAPEDGLFVDQRWVDFVPSLFDHYILRDPGYNVAYWNLGERNLTWAGESYEVDGKPLVFAHFSGYDPTRPFLLSKHNLPNPRVLLSEQSDLVQICGEYGQAMLDAGFAQARTISFNLDDLPNGSRLDRHMRSLYRDGLTAYEDPADEETEMPPSPFADTDAFFEWLAEPVGEGYPDVISRYLHSLLESRPDLAAAFGDVRLGGVIGFLTWIIEHGRTEESIPYELLPDRDAISMLDTEDEDGDFVPQVGVNVAGYLKAELGVGEAARKMAETVVAADEALSMLAYGGTPSRQEHPIEGLRQAGIDAPPYDVNIITINADSTVQFAVDVGQSFFDRRYTVGMWAWEVEEFPEAWLPAFEIVDEVWMNSAYGTDIVAEVANKPVYNFPLAVSVPDSDPLPKDELDLPDRFMFLFSFDFFSVFERKNPLALVEAFARAFEPGAGPILLIKSINGDKRVPELEELKMAAREHPDIYVMDGYLLMEIKNRLMATCDAYVSLHRSEGFGLTMAEAMALGKPTIATGYSGNLEFMNDENSYLIDYERTTVPQGCEPYPAGAAWAEPSIEHAAALMRAVYENPDDAAKIGAEARKTIARDHSPEARARLLKTHLKRIRTTRDEWMPGRAAPSSAVARGVPSALYQASIAIERPIENQWLDDSSGSLTGRFRAGALSSMRPALARERAIDEALLLLIEELWEHVRGVESLALRSASMLAIEQGRMNRVDRDVQQMAEVQNILEEQLRRLGERQQDDADGASEFRGTASAHLSELSDLVQNLEQWSKATDASINARPYMSDPDVFLADDGSMGFVNGGNGDPYRDFENIFRGDESLIRDRQQVYVSLINAEGPVLDAGSGRGEFLDLMAQEAIEAIGVDLDEGMVERSKLKGHDVVLGDVIDYLREVPDGYFSTVFSAQFIEHLPLAGLVQFLELSARKLRPGGVFIAETVNPHALHAFRTFWTDLTHRAPIYPEVALSLVKSSGFSDGRIVFPNGSGALDSDMITEGEYAVVAHASG